MDNFNATTKPVVSKRGKITVQETHVTWSGIVNGGNQQRQLTLKKPNGQNGLDQIQCGLNLQSNILYLNLSSTNNAFYHHGVHAQVLGSVVLTEEIPIKKTQTCVISSNQQCPIQLHSKKGKKKLSLSIRIFGDIDPNQDVFKVENLADDVEADDDERGKSLMQELMNLNLKESADAWLQGSDGASKKVPCLRFVLGLRSPAFAAMFETANADEAKSGVVTIEDFDSDTLRAFWNFLLRDETTGWKEDNGQLAIEMLALGDRYLIKRLKSIASEILSEIINDLNALAVLVASDLHRVETLTQAALCHIGTSRNFKAAEMEELPKELRMKVVDRLLRGQ